MLSRLWNRINFQLTHRLGLRPRYEFGVVSVRPLILYTHYDSSLWELLEKLRGVELHLLITCWWSLTVEDQRDIALRLKAWMATEPNHRILHMVPDETEAEVLRRYNVPHVICHQNCLVDERVFRILPETKKRYRAIYDARLTFFKRHYLAANVRDLALITYLCDADHRPSYNQETREALAGAIWLNGPYSNHPGRFSSEQITVHFNEARVGLILSELEGANYASIQYLLCGLPVVTTRNRGGRDAFFDPSYVIWAEDSPESVAQAVDELIERNLDPEMIREATLRKMRAHRAVFEQVVTTIGQGQWGPRNPAPCWDTFFENKLLRRHSPMALLTLKWKSRIVAWEKHRA